MPVEIREIVIQAKVEDEDAARAPEPVDVAALKSEILDACADMIRKALERIGER